MEIKIRQSFSLDPDIVARLDKNKGRHNKSAFVNDVLGKFFDEIESKAV